MSTFTRKVYMPVTLEPHELGLEVREHLRAAVMRRYLHKESTGIMPKEIRVCEDVALPLGEIVNNQVVVRVPCQVTYKYYRVGDTVRGTLHITDESDISVACGTCCAACGATRAPSPSTTASTASCATGRSTRTAAR